MGIFRDSVSTRKLLLFACAANGAMAGLPTLTDVLGEGFSGKFLPVPLVRQSRNFTCGAAALQGMLGYFGEDFREVQLEKFLGTHPNHGTSVASIANFLEAMANPDLQKAFRRTLGKEELSERPPTAREAAKPFVHYRFRMSGRRELFELQGPAAPDCTPVGAPVGTSADLAASVELGGDGGWDDVKQSLDRGNPVLVVMQAWAQKPSDYGVRWDSGHYTVVVGYDEKRVYLMDPSTTGNYTSLRHEEFQARWYDYHGELSHLTGERCPGGQSFYRFNLELSADRPPYDSKLIIPLE